MGESLLQQLCVSGKLAAVLLQAGQGDVSVDQAVGEEQLLCHPVGDTAELKRKPPELLGQKLLLQVSLRASQCQWQPKPEYAP